jgi:anaerobic C4-dicarboxylate transporter
MTDKRTLGWILMIAGGLAWLAGELIGVHSARANDTTSEWVWWLQKQPWVGPTVRVLVGAFVLSLAAHFWFGTPLLP